MALWPVSHLGPVRVTNARRRLGLGAHRDKQATKARPSTTVSRLIACSARVHRVLQCAHVSQVCLRTSVLKRPADRSGRKSKLPCVRAHALAHHKRASRSVALAPIPTNVRLGNRFTSCLQTLRPRVKRIRRRLSRPTFLAWALRRHWQCGRTSASSLRLSPPMSPPGLDEHIIPPQFPKLLTGQHDWGMVCQASNPLEPTLLLTGDTERVTHTERCNQRG